MNRKHILALAAAVSVAAAAFQLVLGLVPAWSAYFLAPEPLLARPVLLFAASVLVAALLGATAAYAASGAGYIRRLPLLRTALVLTGAVFLVRGWVFIPLALASAGVVNAPVEFGAAALGSSAAFFVLAVLYLAGAAANWHQLGSRSQGRHEG